MNCRKLLILLTAVALTACQGPAGENGVDGIAGDQGDQGDQGLVGETGAAGQDLAAPGAAIAAVAPNALLVGRTTTLRVVGYFTNWDETTTVSFTDGDDNAIEGVEATAVAVSPVGLVVTVTVAESAALGAGAQVLFKQIGIEIPGPPIAVHEHGLGAHITHGVGGRDEGHRRDDHLVSRAHAEEHERQMKSPRAAGERGRVTHAGARRDLRLKASDVRAKGRDPVGVKGVQDQLSFTAEHMRRRQVNSRHRSSFQLR